MKTNLLRIAGLMSAGILSASHAVQAQTTLSTEHVDIGVAYEDGAWDLHVHDETNDVEYEPADAILQVGATAETTVSSNPLFSFLGTAGSATWILPAVQNPGLLFLGFGAEEIESGVFAGDSISVHLRSVNGPGTFAVFAFDGATGNPQVFMNSGDGFGAGDSFLVPAGGHSDLNWAFSAPGTYTVSFEASGTLVDGNAFITSGPVDYTFQVVPEPSTWALLGVSFAGFVLWQLRRRHTAAQP
ncbi:MAG: choice-of-anchor M domain-containing protein [Verrucomicrobia bacterium]|nr:choice-of-anchor M domain-containing protein [Verrucomicrobiota bacterium]